MRAAKRFDAAMEIRGEVIATLQPPAEHEIISARAARKYNRRGGNRQTASAAGNQERARRQYGKARQVAAKPAGIRNSVIGN